MLLAPAGPGAWSQATGPIKIVVPYTPGSGPDILSRLMAEQIGHAQGPTVVVENRPGGGTVIGTEAVERAEPDGRTVLLVANSFVINPPLQRASYNPTTSFEPVCYLAATPMVLVVLGSSPYRTLNDLITAARAKPGDLAFASGGPGSSLHIAIEVLKRAANINITYVPYGGTAPAINALMGNRVEHLDTPGHARTQAPCFLSTPSAYLAHCPALSRTRPDAHRQPVLLLQNRAE